MNTQNENDREQAGPPQTQEEQSRSFRLRAEPPRVTRLSRKVLAGGSALALLVIGGAVLWSLQSNRPRNQATDELYSTDHHNLADGITRRCRRTTRVSHAKPCRSLVRRSQATSVDRSWPLKASRRRPAEIRNSNAGIKRARRPVSAICSLRPMEEKRVRPALRQLEASASCRRTQRAPARMDLRKTRRTENLPL